MTILFLAVACAIICIGLFRWALSFTIDPSPVGSMMMFVSFGFGVVGVALFGAGIAILLTRTIQ